jgi:hypothetical protein
VKDPWPLLDEHDPDSPAQTAPRGEFEASRVRPCTDGAHAKGGVQPVDVEPGDAPGDGVADLLRVTTAIGDQLGLEALYEAFRGRVWCKPAVPIDAAPAGLKALRYAAARCIACQIVYTARTGCFVAPSQDYPE